jgi:hypothetical protein
VQENEENGKLVTESIIERSDDDEDHEHTKKKKFENSTLI